jgi:glycosyltransferase involved in cell wall biosynthesis
VTDVVTVAIPVRDGGPLLDEVLSAVRAQDLDAEVELLVADSGSRDHSIATARRHGAEVITIAPGTYSHGGTRNDLVRRASGRHVAFLTQDATPADRRWLARLLDGFDAADDVALTYGPYRPRPDAPLPVRRELESWFASMAPNGRACTVRLEQAERPIARRLIPQARLFFSDANGCVAREAWEQVPFADVPYAEDRLLAADLLAAGYAKVFVPDAAVLHSHRYPPIAHLRRSFDEWRALREVSGYVEPLDVGRVLRAIREDRAFGVGRLASGLHHSTRAVGAFLGSRAERLPPGVRRRLSLEGRA